MAVAAPAATTQSLCKHKLPALARPLASQKTRVSRLAKLLQLVTVRHFFFFNVAETHHSFARYLLIELYCPNYSLQCPTTGPACERKSRVSEGHPNSDQKRNLNPCRHQRTLPSQQSPLLRTRALFHTYINDLFEECDSLVEFTLKTFFSRDCQRKSYAHAFQKCEWKTSKKVPSSFRHRCPRPSFFRISERFSDRLRE